MADIAGISKAPCTMEPVIVNSDRAILIRHNDQVKTIAEWAKDNSGINPHGLSISEIAVWMAMGESLEDALGNQPNYDYQCGRLEIPVNITPCTMEPVIINFNQPIKVRHNGQVKTITEWAHDPANPHGLSIADIAVWMARGESLAIALANHSNSDWQDFDDGLP